MKLGVNIDHIATLRNARGQNNPNLLRALKVCQEARIDTLTVHLREDRRHIKDNDAKKICSIKNLLVNLEISKKAQENRFILLGLMTAAGWDCYLKEWWHYQLFDSKSYELLSDKALETSMIY